MFGLRGFGFIQAGGVAVVGAMYRVGCEGPRIGGESWARAEYRLIASAAPVRRLRPIAVQINGFRFMIRGFLGDKG